MTNRRSGKKSGGGNGDPPPPNGGVREDEGNQDVLPQRLFATDRYPAEGRFNCYSKPEYLLDVVQALEGTEDIEPLLDSCFKTLFSIQARHASMSGKLVHQVLCRALHTQRVHELWFIFGGQPIRFSIREFAIVTGLNCGPYPDAKTTRALQTPEDPDNPYWYTLFQTKKPVVYIKDIVEQLKRDKRKPIDKQMESWRRVRLAMIVIVEGVLLAGTQPVKASKEVVEMVKDLASFEAYPWGRKCFENTLRMVKVGERVLNVEELAVKFGQTHAAVHGFPLAIQLLFLYLVPELDAEIPMDTGRKKLRHPSIVALQPCKVYHNSTILDIENKLEFLIPAYIPERVHQEVYDDNWADEVVDNSVVYMERLIGEGFEFTKDSWIGGNQQYPKIVVEPKVVKREVRGKGKEKVNDTSFPHHCIDCDALLVSIDEKNAAHLAEIEEAMKRDRKAIMDELLDEAVRILRHGGKSPNHPSPACTYQGRDEEIGEGTPGEKVVVDIDESTSADTEEENKDEQGLEEDKNDEDGPCEQVVHSKDDETVGNVVKDICQRYGVQGEERPDVIQGQQKEVEGPSAIPPSVDQVEQSDQSTLNEGHQLTDSDGDKEREPRTIAAAREALQGRVESGGSNLVMHHELDQDVETEQLHGALGTTPVVDKLVAVGDIVARLTFTVGGQNISVGLDAIPVNKVEKNTKGLKNAPTRTEDVVMMGGDDLDGKEGGGNEVVKKGTEKPQSKSPRGRKRIASDGDDDFEDQPLLAKRVRKPNTRFGNTTPKKKSRSEVVYPLAIVEKGTKKKFLTKMKGSKTKQYMVNGRFETKQFFIDIYTPEFKLEETHINAIMSLMWTKLGDGLLEKRIAILDSWFVRILLEDYSRFKKLKKNEKLGWSSNIKNYVRGVVPGRPNRLGWLTEVDTIYAPMCWGGNHWVSLCISLAASSIKVIDPCLSKNDDVKVEKQLMKPLVDMIPVVVNELASPETPYEGPFKVWRDKSCSQFNKDAEIAPLAVTFINAIAQGLPLEGIDEEVIEGIRMCYAVDMFDEFGQSLRE